MQLEATQAASRPPCCCSSRQPQTRLAAAAPAALQVTVSSASLPPISPAAASKAAAAKAAAAKAADASNKPFMAEVQAARFFYMDQFVLLACGSKLNLYKWVPLRVVLGVKTSGREQ